MDPMLGMPSFLIESKGIDEASKVNTFKIQEEGHVYVADSTIYNMTQQHYQRRTSIKWIGGNILTLLSIGTQHMDHVREMHRIPWSHFSTLF